MNTFDNLVFTICDIKTNIVSKANGKYYINHNTLLGEKWFNKFTKNVMQFQIHVHTLQNVLFYSLFSYTVILKWSSSFLAGHTLK